ncbi:MAG TPA: MaoC family dehydratase N-terminal domain-containing protein [Nocardioides sp.]|jgi:acyl dehydratase|uniref:FAS1-like dehydratase domain-containing protein n=1 Tax=Nocardioides sp. TaxID=35761 RepID=UPI002B7E59F4|nr:MaoC family dehydratase N-terminal domain-containing protein [Nocardioides sp.]HTW16795.1 MaoC family dehydratase N-terminal domain-containing protein [Nocardioides sp.]
MTQQTQDLVPEAAAAQVGALVATATGDVLRREWQRWAVAVGDRNPLWFDVEHARAQGYDDVVAPPLYLQYAVLGVTPLDTLRADGSSGAVSGDLAFPDAPRRMAGGESTTFHRYCGHGDVVTMERRVESIVQKQGRSGPFVLVTWRTTYTDQRDELVAEATTSMIARP